MAKDIEILLGIKQDVGALLQGMKDTNQHILAVSENQKKTAKALQDHIDEDGAHGVARTLSLIKWLAGVGPVLVGGVLWLLHK